MNRLLEKPITQLDVAVVDIETTGFSPRNDSVIEVAAVKIRNGKIADKFQSLIYTSFIPYYATRVHGIDIDMVADAPSRETVAVRFSGFVEDCILAGHNIAAFDLPFLCTAFKFDAQEFCVDTLKISRMLFPGERTHRLAAVAERLGVKNARYHRALDDALVTARVFLELLKINKKGFKILKDIIA